MPGSEGVARIPAYPPGEAGSAGRYPELPLGVTETFPPYPARFSPLCAAASASAMTVFSRSGATIST